MIFENSTIGTYHLIKCCGSGTYGKVFLAKDSFTGYPVAVKTLLADTKMMQRELRGLINYRKCRHENLLKIHHIDEIDNIFYYVMDLADNLNHSLEDYEPDTLANRLKRQPRLPASELLIMHDELLTGLKILHSNNIIHRDIKPDNIMWVNGKAVLGDIGLVTENIGSTMVGTPEFMSPALLNRKRSANESDDLYSLSRVLYCAFSGFPPERFPQLPAGLLKEPDAPLLWNKILILDQKSSPGTTRSGVREFRMRRISRKVALAVAAGILAIGIGAAVLISTAEPETAAVDTATAEPDIEPPPMPENNMPIKLAVEGSVATDLRWTTGATPSEPADYTNWRVCDDDGFDDKTCVSSGNYGGDIATSWLRTTVTGPCRISFNYKLRTYSGRFLIQCDTGDLLDLCTVTGLEVFWQYAEYDIPAGEHTITFTYFHRGVGYSNVFNGVWLDNFRVTPL